MITQTASYILYSTLSKVCEMSPEKWRWLPPSSLSSFLRLTTTSSRLWAPKPNCRGHPYGARLPPVHLQCWYKLLVGPFFLAPALHNPPASFLQMTTTRYHTGNRITDRVAVTRILNTQCKHTLERPTFPQHKQISPRCVHYRNIQMIHYKVPCSTTNLYH